MDLASVSQESGQISHFTDIISLDKELWEPALNALFRLQDRDPYSHMIREVWAFDWQAHGDSAILNADELKHREEAISMS